jgi:tRNA(fMet)-specific endonuclease VapC
MGVLIDASVLIAYERGGVNVAQHIAHRSEESFYVSVITASELLHGVHRASEAGVRRRRSAFVEAVLERFPLLDIDVKIARAHAQLWADLAAAGTLIGAHDLWLAASCTAHDLALVTANVREFERVNGLVLENWSK